MQHPSSVKTLGPWKPVWPSSGSDGGPSALLRSPARPDSRTRPSNCATAGRAREAAGRTHGLPRRWCQLARAKGGSGGSEASHCCRWGFMSWRFSRKYQTILYEARIWICSRSRLEPRTLRICNCAISALPPELLKKQTYCAFLKIQKINLITISFPYTMTHDDWWYCTCVYERISII